MSRVTSILFFCLFVVFAPTAEAGKPPPVGNCQILIGIDMSDSVPWNKTRDELNFAVDLLTTMVANTCKKGDKIIIKTFGTFQDRTTSNPVLVIYPVRRPSLNKSSFKKTIFSVVDATKKDQKETSILGYLHNLPCLEPTLPVCKILVLTDGFEYSEFGSAQEFAAGKKLPLPRKGYLSGIDITFIGFGNTTDESTSKTVEGLKVAWSLHFEKAGARCRFINW